MATIIMMIINRRRISRRDLTHMEVHPRLLNMNILAATSIVALSSEFMVSSDTSLRDEVSHDPVCFCRQDI